MAINSFIRRASSAIIPLSIRSVGYWRHSHGAISVLNVENRCLVGGQFLPSVGFSTDTNNNLAHLLESVVGRCEPAPDTISHFPFEIEDIRDDYYYLHLKTVYKKERIFVKMQSPVSILGEGPFYGMLVRIVRGHDQEIYFDIFCKKDQYKIVGIYMRNNPGCKHLENFEEFIGSKGIKSGMVNMLFDHFGMKPNNNTTPNHPS